MSEKKSTNLVKLKITGSRKNIDKVVKVLAKECEVLDQSGSYPNRGSDDLRCYVLLWMGGE